MTAVTKSIKTTTKHVKSQQHMRSMKYWKKLLNQEQQQPSVKDSSFEFDEMDQPSFLEHSNNNIIPKPELPGQILNSLNEMKDHGFDPDSNAPAF